MIRLLLLASTGKMNFSGENFEVFVGSFTSVNCMLIYAWASFFLFFLIFLTSLLSLSFPLIKFNFLF